MTIKAVLFDFGDTLFHRSGGHRAVIDVAAGLGAEVDEGRAAEIWEAIQSSARTPEELAKGRDLSDEAHRQCWTALYRSADVLVEGMADALYERERDPRNWQPFEDTVGTLRCLRAAGIPLGVVSDTGWDIRPVLERAGLLDMFATMVLSCEHGVVKPASLLFAAACRALGSDPAETLMVGDNPLTDGGAVSAGLTAFVLPPWAGNGPRGFAPILRLISPVPQRARPWVAPVNTVEKPWGREEVFALVDGRFCGKAIHVTAGEALSLQYHEYKEETIAVQSGLATLDIGHDDEKLDRIELAPGEAVHLLPGTRHRITAITDVVLLEASTTELNDVVRLEDRYGRTATNHP